MKNDLTEKGERRRTRIIDKGGDKTRSLKLRKENRDEKNRTRHLPRRRPSDN